MNINKFYNPKAYLRLLQTTACLVLFVIATLLYSNTHESKAAAPIDCQSLVDKSGEE